MFYACQLLVEDSLDREARLTLGYSPASRVAVRERHGDLDKIWENSTTAQQREQITYKTAVWGKDRNDQQTCILLWIRIRDHRGPGLVLPPCILELGSCWWSKKQNFGSAAR